MGAHVSVTLNAKLLSNQIQINIYKEMQFLITVVYSRRFIFYYGLEFGYV